MTDKPEVGSRKSAAGAGACSAPFRACVDERAPAAGLSVLFVGDCAHDEFRAAVEMLDEHGAVTFARDVAAAREDLIRNAWSPSLIVIAQARPGEHAEAELDALRRAAPLAPLVCLLGTLCEGESRSGSPYPGGVRIYWHQWRERAWPELLALQAGRASSWSLPATASDEERLLCSASERITAARGLVAIASASFEMADWLASACREQGFDVLRTCASRPAVSPQVSVVVWDAGPAENSDLDDLAALLAAYPSAKLIVLADFPRLEHYERLLRAGAAAVLSKPVMLAELFGQLAASY